MIERPQGSIAYHYPISVAAEFGARRPVLQVVFPIMFCHPGAFDERVEESVVVVFAKTLPSETVRVKEGQFLAGADGLKGLAVQPDAIEGIGIAASIIHV